MSDTEKSELEKILDELDRHLLSAYKTDQVNQAWELGKSRIQALITQQCNQARIEILKNVWHTSPYECTYVKDDEGEIVTTYDFAEMLEAQAKETEGLK